MAPRPIVLHYTGAADDSGGIVSVVRALAAADRFDCIFGLSPGAVQRRLPALPAVELPRMDGERIGVANAWRASAAADAVQRWLHVDPARVFHGHSRAGLLVALWLRRWGERRVVASVHCYGRQRWFYRWAARRLGDRLFWLSPAMRAYYGILGGGWEQCIPGGVPPAKVVAAAREPGRLRLGGVGMLVDWKRWDLVVEALGRLPASLRPAVRFTHIGAGDAAPLEQRAARLGVRAQVAFLGPQPSPDALLAEIDALVVASVREPLSMAMLEALAAGVPVLAADSGGACDLIRDGVNGRLFRTGDPVALADAIRDWQARPPGFDPVVIRATTSRADDVAERWLRVYEQL